MRGPRWPEVTDIRSRRRKLGVRQSELSRIAGIPQSIISRIENGNIVDPSYSTMRKLSDALDRLDSLNSGNKNSKELRAANVLNPHVVTVKPYDKAGAVWAIMAKKNFSQLPVVDDKGHIVGGVWESSFLAASVNGGAESSSSSGNGIVADKKVEDIMGDDTFPIIGRETRLRQVAHILLNETAVLVMEKGRLAGIITRYDLMEKALLRDPQAL